MESYLHSPCYKPDFAAQSRVFTSEADFTGMDRGTADVKRDPPFWEQLLRAYEWLDVSKGCIQADLEGESNVSEEALVFFTPGMREERNREILRRDTQEGEEGATVRIWRGVTRSSSLGMGMGMGMRRR